MEIGKKTFLKELLSRDEGVGVMFDGGKGFGENFFRQKIFEEALGEHESPSAGMSVIG